VQGISADVIARTSSELQGKFRDAVSKTVAQFIENVAPAIDGNRKNEIENELVMLSLSLIRLMAAGARVSPGLYFRGANCSPCAQRQLRRGFQ
jgi:hypothetical protein